MNQRTIDRWVGGYLILSVVASSVYYNLVYAAGYYEFLWYCNIAFLAAGAGFLAKKPVWITAVFLTALPAQLFWVYADVLYLTGLENLGRNAWRRENYHFGVLLDLNYHWMIFPVTYYGVRKYGYQRKGFQTALLLFVPLLLLTYFVTKPVDNINCVFYPCDIQIYDESMLREYGGKHLAKSIVIYAAAIAALHFFFRKFGSWLKVRPD